MRESRLPALAGIAFAMLFLAALFLLVGDLPEYGATDAEWTRWAEDSDAANRVSLLLMMLAGVAFLLFAGPLRRAQEGGTLATTALAGGVVGMSGMVVAAVLMRLAGVHGADSDPTITRSLVEAAAAGFLLASFGFCAHLLAIGLETLRTGAFARWSGIVALVGAGGFLLTFGTAVDASTESAFGLGYPLGFLCLVIWSIAAGLRLSAVATPSQGRRLPSTR